MWRYLSGNSKMVRVICTFQGKAGTDLPVRVLSQCFWVSVWHRRFAAFPTRGSMSSGTGGVIVTGNLSDTRTIFGSLSFMLRRDLRTGQGFLITVL